MEPRQPHYWPIDAITLASRWLPESARFGGLGMLAAIERDGRGYRKFLAEYPRIRCEPLEPLYGLRWFTGSLDRDLLDDMLLPPSDGHLARLGTFAAIFAPDPAYLPTLRSRQALLPKTNAALQVAIAACEHVGVDDKYAEAARLAASIRELLAELPPLSAPLRPMITPEQEASCRREEHWIRELHRRKGEAAARTWLGRGMTGYWRRSHAEWMARGALPPPAAGD